MHACSSIAVQSHRAGQEGIPDRVHQGPELETDFFVFFYDHYWYFWNYWHVVFYRFWYGDGGIFSCCWINRVRGTPGAQPAAARGPL